jgi:hypothetical protein
MMSKTLVNSRVGPVRAQRVQKRGISVQVIETTVVTKQSFHHHRIPLCRMKELLDDAEEQMD